MGLEMNDSQRLHSISKSLREIADILKIVYAKEIKEAEEARRRKIDRKFELKHSFGPVIKTRSTR